MVQIIFAKQSHQNPNKTCFNMPSSAYKQLGWNMSLKRIVLFLAIALSLTLCIRQRDRSSQHLTSSPRKSLNHQKEQKHQFWEFWKKIGKTKHTWEEACVHKEGQVCTIHLGIFDRQDCCVLDSSGVSYCDWGFGCESASMDIYSADMYW